MSKAYLDGGSTRVLLVDQCRHLIGSLFVHTVDDDMYYLHTVEEASQIIQEARIYALAYIPEISDCDDFQTKTVNVFRERSYVEAQGKRKRRAPSCFGIASSWDHAFNAMINADHKVRFVEPQTGEIILPKDMQTGIVQVEW